MAGRPSRWALAHNLVVMVALYAELLFKAFLDSTHMGSEFEGRSSGGTRLESIALPVFLTAPSVALPVHLESYIHVW